MASPVTAASEPSAAPAPKGRRRWVKRFVVVVAIAVVGALAAGGLWISGIGRVTRLSPDFGSAPPGLTVVSPDDAPFSYPGEDKIGVIAPLGEPWSFGSLVLANRSDRPVTITKIEAGEVGEGTEFLGVKLAVGQLRDPLAIGRSPGYPALFRSGADYRDPPVEMEPAGPSDLGVDLVVGVNSLRPGYRYVRGVVMTYRTDGHDYQTTYNNLFLICTDPAQPCTWDLIDHG